MYSRVFDRTRRERDHDTLTYRYEIQTSNNYDYITVLMVRTFLYRFTAEAVVRT